METPLSRAAHNGHLQTVAYLTEQGAAVNCLDLVMLSHPHPLCIGALQGNMSCQLLQEHIC